MYVRRISGRELFLYVSILPQLKIHSAKVFFHICYKYVHLIEYPGLVAEDDKPTNALHRQIMNKPKMSDAVVFSRRCEILMKF